MAGDTMRVASDSFMTRSRRDSSDGCSSGRSGSTRPSSVDLVTAARRHLSFLRSFASLPVLYHAPTVARAIGRYERLWMPLISELAQEAPPSAPPMLLPPPDVHWVWHCHCIDPAGCYSEYCISRFGALVDRPLIIDDENEEYAYSRCREIWSVRYPFEPFDLDVDSAAAADGEESSGESGGRLFTTVAGYRTLHSFFSDPFISETVYLVAARRRYFSFLQLSKRLEDGLLRVVPTSDILLMWLTHRSYPRSYAKDTQEMGDLARVIVGFGHQAGEEEREETARLWEEAFDEPYERAGAMIDPLASPSRIYFNWEAPETDVNRSYTGMKPRFLMKVSVFLKGTWEKNADSNLTKKSLRLQTLRCHRHMKLDEPVFGLSSETWRKTWYLYCEFATRGILVEVRQRGSSCLSSSKLITTLVFLWNDVLRSTALTLEKELDMQVRVLASITSPVQAPYLLKCVPDRVTDDSGAMISDVVLKMNRYHPQQGRWLSRTVLDHARRECFVIRIRVGRGIWRRGAETPEAVKWEDRIIEVRQGSWSYIAGTVGTAPDKIVGTATPKKEDSQVNKALWSLSTGDVLSIQLDGELRIQLENERSGEQVKLLIGRKLQYQVKNGHSAPGKWHEEEDHYLTLVRFTSEHPGGKATALLNWKLLAVEFSPDEDAVLVLLACVAVARTISQIRRIDASGLLVRRRVREVAGGQTDWGSIMLPSSSPRSSIHVRPWYWNASEVLASAEMNDSAVAPVSKQFPEDGRCAMYEQVIFSA